MAQVEADLAAAKSEQLVLASETLLQFGFHRLVSLDVILSSLLKLTNTHSNTKA